MKPRESSQDSVLMRKQSAREMGITREGQGWNNNVGVGPQGWRVG